MKKNFIYAFVLLVSGIWSGQNAVAQDKEKDDNKLQREMVLEKEFTPMVRDASKINVLPQVESPQINKTAVRYSAWATPVVPVNGFNPLPAADYDTSYPFSTKRGYFNFSGGNYLNLKGNLGYKFLDTAKDEFGMWLQHNSTNGKVKNVDADGKSKLKRNDNRLNLYYKHNFASVSFLLNAGYQFNSFNYYGVPVVSSSVVDDIYTWFPQNKLADFNKNQTAQQFGGRLGIVSHDDLDLQYKALVGFNRYANKLGYYYGEDGAAENHVHSEFALSSAFNEKYRIGADVEMDNLFYSDGGRDNYTNIALNPYFNINNESFKVRLGLTADVAFNQGKTLSFSPDVRMNWEFAESVFLFSDIVGGKTLNTYARLSESNIYVNPSLLPKDSHTPIDATIGLRSNYFSGFWFEVFGGYKMIDDDALGYRLLDGNAFPTEDRYLLSRNAISYQNMKTSCWNAGVAMKYKYEDWLDVAVKLKKNGWDLRKGDGDVFDRPDFEANAGVTFKLANGLAFNLDYYLATGRKYKDVFTLTPFDDNASTIDPIPFTGTKIGSLKDIHSLSLGANYEINKTVNVFVNLNNLMFQKYDLWHGMAAQGFNAMGGVGLKF